jgi:small ligand-binding sensory domain FIST
VLFGEPEERREWVKDGLLLGIAIDEHKRPLGRGDFLVRELLGVRPEKGQLVCGTPPRVGSTVRFHLRDSDAACEDLVMLLDAQQLKGPPPAALVFGCRTRGARLHGEPETDAIIVHSHLDKPSQAGCFMAAEFAPVDGRTRVNGHSVGVAPIRRAP